MKGYKEPKEKKGNYYDLKRKAMSLTDVFIKKGAYNQEKIAFFVEKGTGISKKFILNYIKDCLDNDFCMKDKETGVLFI